MIATDRSLNRKAVYSLMQKEWNRSYYHVITVKAGSPMIMSHSQERRRLERSAGKKSAFVSLRCCSISRLRPSRVLSYSNVSLVARLTSGCDHLSWALARGSTVRYKSNTDSNSKVLSVFWDRFSFSYQTSLAKDVCLTHFRGAFPLWLSTFSIFAFCSSCFAANVLFHTIYFDQYCWIDKQVYIGKRSPLI